VIQADLPFFCEDSTTLHSTGNRCVLSRYFYGAV